MEACPSARCSPATWKSLVLEDWSSRREAESDLTGGLHPKWCEDDVLQHRVNIPVSSLERTLDIEGEAPQDGGRTFAREVQSLASDVHTD